MANRYWIGGSGNWTDTAHWSDTDGGAGGSSSPTSVDNVFITTNSGMDSNTERIIEDGGSTQCYNFTSTCGHTYIIEYDDSDLEIFGSAIFESGTTFDYDSYAYTQFVGTGNHTITWNGAYIVCLSFKNSDGVWIFIDDCVVGDGTYGNFNLYSGTINANNRDITAYRFVIYFNGTKSIFYMGDGTLEINGDNFYVNNSATIICENSTIKFTNTTSRNKYFEGSGKEYNNLWITGTGTGLYYISDSNTFNNIKIDTPPKDVRFETNSIQTVTSFTARGEDGKLISLRMFYD